MSPSVVSYGSNSRARKPNQQELNASWTQEAAGSWLSMCVGTWRALGVWRIFRGEAAGGLFASKATTFTMSVQGPGELRWKSDLSLVVHLECSRVSRSKDLSFASAVFRVSQTSSRGFWTIPVNWGPRQCDRLNGPKEPPWKTSYLVRNCVARSLPARCAKYPIVPMTGMCAGSRMTRDQWRYDQLRVVLLHWVAGKTLNGRSRYHRNIAMLPAVFHPPSMRIPLFVDQVQYEDRVLWHKVEIAQWQ